MAWGDPAAPYAGPSWDFVAQNPALRDALLAFGSSMLTHARDPGMRGIGESIGAGAQTWANRREVYLKEAQRRALEQKLAPGHPSPIGAPITSSRDPNLRSAYDLPLGTPVPTQLVSGPGTPAPPGWQYTPSYDRGVVVGSPASGNPPVPPGTSLYQPGTNLPTRQALEAGLAAMPGAAGAPSSGATPDEAWMPPRPTAGPYMPPLPGVAGPGRSPSTPLMVRPPITGGTAALYGAPGATGAMVPGGPTVVPLGSGGPTGGAVSDPSGLWSSAARPGFFNPSGGPGTQFAGNVGTSTQLGGADADVLANRPLWQRNNNPGNLRYVGQEGATKGDAGFAKFASMEQGVDALKKQVERYGSGATTGKPLRSLRQIISTWAPPNENQTDLLIQNAARRMGISPDQELDTSDPAVQDQLANVLTQQETGRTLADLGTGTPTPRRTQVAGAQGQATMQGGAEQDVLAGFFNPSAGPGAQFAGDVGGETGGMYDAQGNLTEDTKRTLRLSLEAGGPEGVQQALMSMINQKPQEKERWEDITDKVPYPVGPNTRIMRNKITGKEEPFQTQPTGPMTIQVGEKGSEAFTKETGVLAAREIDATRTEAAKATAMAQDYAPVLERMKTAVLEGREDESGWWRSTTSPFRKIATSFGLDPETATEDQMLEAKRGFWYQRMRDPHSGNPTEKEDTRLLAGMAGVGNTTLSNYLLTKGLENQSRYQTWLLGKKQEYASRIDPNTNQPVGNLTLFDKWLNTPDANGRAPIEDRPRLYVDLTDPKDAQRAKDMDKGDLLLDQQGKVKVLKYKESELTPESWGKIKPGDPIQLKDGSIYIAP